MRSSKKTDKRKLLSHLRALSSDPNFVAGAKEILARKPRPFDYDGRRNDDSQIKYEVGRLMAIRILQSSLCFLVALALWAVPALAQQRWWMLVRGVGGTLDTCNDHPQVESPAKMYEGTLANGWPAQIVDQGDEVNVYTTRDGEQMKVSYFRTQEACRRSAQEHIAEKAKVDKYR
jgi:hypothetical protein